MAASAASAHSCSQSKPCSTVRCLHCAKTTPGSAGLGILGDNSVSFYRDPLGFGQKHAAKHKAGLFLSRFLGKPTVFVCSNQGVLDLLHCSASQTSMGYRQYLLQIFGESILFLDGEDAEALRLLMHSVFDANWNLLFQDKIDRISDGFFTSLQTGSPLCVYKLMKRVATQLCLSMFLDLDFEASAELCDDIVALTTAHWHGIISLPLKLKLPWPRGGESGFSRAMQAKERLIEIIGSKLKSAEDGKSGFLSAFSSLGFSCRESLVNHVLLLTCALVPKAMGSLMASFVFALHQFKEVDHTALARFDEEYFDHVFLEVSRLWPPFLGGRRVTNKPCVIDGHVVKEDLGVVFLTYLANRDAQVFPQPDTFRPARWSRENASDHGKVLTFGAGTRACVGQRLVQHVMKSICRRLVKEYTWEVSANQNLALKYLPTVRPKADVMAVFEKSEAGKEITEG